MTARQFITKQYIKYYWKVLTDDNRDYATDVPETQTDSFWEYEQTPRVLK